MNDSYYIAIDPGYTSGYACFDEKGQMTDFNQIQDPDDFMDWLESKQPKVLILEDYIIRKGVSHSGSRAPTIQLIGVIKRWAKTNNIDVVLQPSHAKEIGYRFAGIPKPTNHAKSHKFDAAAHGVYYLQKIGVRESRVQAG